MIKKVFLGFFEVHAKDAATREGVLLESLTSGNISMANCRSQCYDNASVMNWLRLTFNSADAPEIRKRCLSTDTTTVKFRRSTLC